MRNNDRCGTFFVMQYPADLRINFNISSLFVVAIFSFSFFINNFFFWGCPKEEREYAMMKFVDLFFINDLIELTVSLPSRKKI